MCPWFYCDTCIVECPLLSWLYADPLTRVYYTYVFEFTPIVLDLVCWSHCCDCSWLCAGLLHATGMSDRVLLSSLQPVWREPLLVCWRGREREEEENMLHRSACLCADISGTCLVSASTATYIYVHVTVCITIATCTDLWYNSYIMHIHKYIRMYILHRFICTHVFTSIFNN